MANKMFQMEYSQNNINPLLCNKFGFHLVMFFEPVFFNILWSVMKLISIKIIFSANT